MASCLALVVAWLMGLEHPQWSAMTVWAVSQPIRGMLVEKSLFRGLGTLVGTLFGVALLQLVGDQLPILVVALSLWIGLCVGLGNLLRGLVAYGTLLSGYSATMVALLGTQQGDGQILLLGVDRLLTVLTGIVVGLVVGLIFTPAHAEDELSGRVRRNTARIVRAMADRLAGRATESRADSAHRLLKEIAVTEELFDSHEAGSLRNRRVVRALRAVVQAQVSCIFWIRSSRNLPQNEALAEALERVAAALETQTVSGEVLAGLEAALALCGEDIVTAEVLLRLLDAQRDQAAVDDGHVGPLIIRNKVLLHRDWLGARHATLRATGLLLLVGSVWLVTDWNAGPYVMLAVSVMITLFSNFETPSHIMWHIFLWQSVAALAALVCQWLIWPFATAEWQLLASLTPFIFLIVPFMAHPRFMLGAVDYAMVLLLLSQPAFPLSASFADSLNIALAVVTGPLLAYITFKTVWPADARRRRIQLTDMMLSELTAMAAAEPSRTPRRAVLRTRLVHRLLKLVASRHRSGKPLKPITSGSLAVYAVGRAIQELREAWAEPGPRVSPRRVAVALERLEGVREDPHGAARSLRLIANHLRRGGHPAAWDVDNAARALEDNADFFYRKRPPRRLLFSMRA